MNKKIFFIVAVSIIVVSKKVLAANEIVDVRRNITLSDDETVAKDFYIKVSDGGLKKNMVVKATRKINVKDTSQKPVGDFNTVVGLVKIIHVEGSIAIAREFKLLPRSDQPMLEQIGIMTGDQINLSDSFIDTSKPAEAKKKVAAAEPVIEAVPEQKSVSKAENKPDNKLEPKDNREPAANVAVPQSTAPQSADPTAPVDSKNIKPDSISKDI